jgi:hypothetical protein
MYKSKAWSGKEGQEKKGGLKTKGVNNKSTLGSAKTGVGKRMQGFFLKGKGKESAKNMKSK